MKGTMAVMGRSGDTKIAWDSDNAAEVAAARKTFDELRGKGFHAFSIRGEGKQGKQVTEFDPDAERLVLVPPVAGG